jgi:hypothetical protein
MAWLLADTFGGTLTRLDAQTVRRGRMRKLRMIVPRRRGNTKCLLIAPGPTDASAFADLDGWLLRFGVAALWVIDSFWHEWIPSFLRYCRGIDHIFVTNEEDVDVWRQRTGRDTSVLHWGTDALRLGSANAHRSTDLLRVGRQPREWDDDQANHAAAAGFGLRYRGRPPMAATSADNERLLMRAFSDARYTLAFSNLVDRQPYTHPTRAYMTGRWTDALAAGAVVCGVTPACDAARSLLWHGAVLELDGTSRDQALPVIARAARDWTPQVAAKNHLEALRRLDWRLRFAELGRRLDLSSPRLDAELRVIAQISASAAAVEPPALGAST